MKKDISLLTDLYFRDDIDEKTPFSDESEAIQTWMHFFDMLLCALLIAKEERRRFSYQGIQVDDETLMGLLEPHIEERPECREKFGDLFQKLILKTILPINETTRLPIADLLWNTQVEAYEFIVIITAFSVDYHKKYQKIFLEMQGETIKNYPSLGIACDLIMLLDEVTLGMRNQLLNRESFLNLFLLEQPPTLGALPVMERPLKLQHNVLEYLMDGAPTDSGILSEFIEIVDLYEKREPVFSHEREINQMASLIAHYANEEKCQILCLFGLEGIGKRFIIETVASLCNISLIVLHANMLLYRSEKEQKEILRNLVIKALIEGRIIYLDQFIFSKEEKHIQWYILSYLSGFSVQLLISATEEIRDRIPKDCNLVSIECCMPTAKEQKDLWQYFIEYGDGETTVIPVDANIEVARLVSCYSLTPQKIRKALQMSRLECIVEQEDKISEAILTKHIRAICKADFQENATRINSGFSWSDLQIDKDAENILKDACNRLFYKEKIYSDWGFQQRMPYGKGLSILLYGPPGTGKTMTAQVLAAEMQLDIYRIDLSQISSKFIGETEKNIGAVFEAAKDSNAILFFDEADALFTKRTDVENANDRYANVETAYLLQKIEEYAGVSILATNNVGNFDAAFKRRISYIVQITAPDIDTRKRLWKHAFPENTPTDKLRLDFYAEKFELVGSNIINIAVSAAFLAAAEQVAVAERHIMKAMKEEYLKVGKIFFEKDMI